MERNEALERLRLLIGMDLRKLADDYGITVFKGDKRNKGWAGHVLERYLCLPQNSSRAPNFGSWELKLVSLHTRRDGSIDLKETMAITMLDPVNIAITEFENSHLLGKLKKAVICSRVYESLDESHSVLRDVVGFDLDDDDLLRQIKEDYDLIRDLVVTKGFESLSGRYGVYIQPRTKGPGHGSISRAFYARKNLLRLILDLNQ